MKRIALAGIIATAVVGVGVFALMNKPETKTPPTQQKTAKNQSQVKPTPVFIHIPGETAFPARVEDYDAPSSLWVLVSKKYPLSDETYVPDVIGKPSVAVNEAKTAEEQSLRTDAIQPVNALFAAAKSAGHDVMVASGYRSYGLQQTYFSSYSAAYGEDAANMFSARPGQSEHQTGLSLDISLTSRQCYLEICFGETAAGKWLAAHAHEYGFILRYPSDKTAVTEYQYEPWHFRYVGNELAGALYRSGLTLDEAHAYLQQARSELKQRGSI